ncbi:hypothetical protein K474DRAFT_1684232 [Panus rudis PR-1116 ss-1]|nr:hypothetical protein K474DRAFT_1684232 [Panus rudis PR-1116 ss-1]
MVELFLKHVLKRKQNSSGIYEETAGYYEIVEQQECLTLHMHMLSNFQKRMVEYLESTHQEQFITEIIEIPIQTLLDPPIKFCSNQCHKCTVDKLLYRSNRYTYNKSYLNNNYGTCKARFPRATYSDTILDSTSGALIMKKGEAWLNTFTPVLTYLLRCNTNITSLLYRTAIKSVVAYMTDYITKSPLKTHTIFEAI